MTAPARPARTPPAAEPTAAGRPAARTPPDLRTRIEHADTDASGVVHFSRYVSLMETAVLEFLEDRGCGISVMAEKGAELVVTELRVRYRSSAVHRDLVVGEAGIENAGAARFLATALLSREEGDGSLTELATGVLSFAVVDSGTGRPVPLPATVRHILKGIVSDAGDGRTAGINGRDTGAS